MLGKVTVIAFHRAKPGKEDDLREALLSLCDPTRAEKGCINYDLHVSADGDFVDKCVIPVAVAIITCSRTFALSVGDVEVTFD